MFFGIEWVGKCVQNDLENEAYSDLFGHHRLPAYTMTTYLTTILRSPDIIQQEIASGQLDIWQSELHLRRCEPWILMTFGRFSKSPNHLQTSLKKVKFVGYVWPFENQWLSPSWGLRIFLRWPSSSTKPWLLVLVRLPCMGPYGTRKEHKSATKNEVLWAGFTIGEVRSETTMMLIKW